METKTNIANKANYKACDGRRIEYIVLHYTANNGDTAVGNGAYFAREKVGASAHYFVDDSEIVQSVKDKDIAWHCETSGLPFAHKACRNSNSIGIEMCSVIEGGKYAIRAKTVDNAVELTKMLMEKYNIPVSRVLRHYDVKPKICPKPWVEDEKLWLEFLKRLEGKEMEKRYNKISELPEWAKPVIEKLVNEGKIADGNNLDLSHDMVRVLVIMGR